MEIIHPGAPLIKQCQGEEVINAFNYIAPSWNHQGYEEAYQKALVDAGVMYPSDASFEGSSVGQSMTREFLEPFFIANEKFHSYTELEDAIDKNHQQRTNPGIFVLGSGNTAMPLILTILTGLVAGKDVYFRASRGNEDAIEVWSKFLKENADGKSHVYTINEMLNRLHPINVPYESPQYQGVIGDLPIQQSYLWGGGAAITNTVTLLGNEVVNYLFGPRTGVLILESDWWNHLDDRTKSQSANALYANNNAFDCALCSSPTFGIYIGDQASAKATLEELSSLIQKTPNEADRLKRLDGANRYRNAMKKWRAYGYSLYNPLGSLVTFAVGDANAHAFKNSYFTMPTSYHESAGSLEFVSFDPNHIDDAAKLAANLQSEPRYADLWSVGHIVTIASSETTASFAKKMAQHQPQAEHTLPADKIRIEDVRSNLGRRPGERFDGIDLGLSMLNM